MKKKIVAPGRWRQLEAWGDWPATLAEWVISRLNEKPCLKKQGKGSRGRMPDLDIWSLWAREHFIPFPQKPPKSSPTDKTSSPQTDKHKSPSNNNIVALSITVRTTDKIPPGVGGGVRENPTIPSASML